MNAILIVFFIILFVILISILPFKVRMMSHLNLITLKLFYSFKFYRFKILCGKAEIVNGKFNILNSNNIIKGNVDKNFASEYLKNISKKMDIKKVELFFEGGFVEDSYLSAIMCGTITSSVRTIYSVLSLKYKNVKLYENILPTFYDTNLELTFDFVISISILQIFMCLIKSSKNIKLKGDFNEN